MKKLFLVIIFILFFLTSSVNAQTMKVLSLENFYTQTPSQTFKIKTIEAEELENEIYLEPGTIISGNIVQVHKPRRGKRDSYFEFHPTTLTYGEKTLDITNSDIYAVIIKYKPIEPKELTFNIARKTANFFLKGMISGIEFIQGAVQGEDGQRIKSGAMNVYRDSFLVYIEAGKELSIHPGDMLILKLKKIR